jgi:hypothetical protein
MKRSFSLLPLALTILALTGCVHDKPAPRLDSGDRNERIEAVRQTQNKYGARSTPTENLSPTAGGVAVVPAAYVSDPAPVEDRQALVGRWNHPWSDVAYFRFAADGTYRQSGLLGSIDGTYRFLPNGVLELNSSGTFFGPNVAEVKYRLSGDTLELHLLGDWFAFIKAKG